jgi:hypothetical protein
MRDIDLFQLALVGRMPSVTDHEKPSRMQAAVEGHAPCKKIWKVKAPQPPRRS